MKTEFIDKTEKKETVFTHIVSEHGVRKCLYGNPNLYKRVEYIGKNKLGDIFKAYYTEDKFNLMIGKKGDEFKM